MATIEETCPQCGHKTRRHRNPTPTVDIIIEYEDQGLILIERGKPPWGWALPGGFVDYGESLETAARREAKEETGLEVELLGQFHTYSDPRRDPRQHNITTVYVARGSGQPRSGDDARNLAVFPPENLPETLAFDHAQILADYLKVRRKWLEKPSKPC
jgi:ADP-ribose pyrophosphatase YjhB (NUDIX family)